MCLWKLSEALTDLTETQHQACLKSLQLTGKAVLFMWLLGHNAFFTKMDCSGSAVLLSYMLAPEFKKAQVQSSVYLFVKVCACTPVGLDLKES